MNMLQDKSKMKALIAATIATGIDVLVYKSRNYKILLF